MIDQKLQPPELKGLGKRIMEQLKDITAAKVKIHMDAEFKRSDEIYRHIDHLMDGVDRKEFIESVSHLRDVGFKLGINGAICGIKLDLENESNNNRLLWTNHGFSEAQNGIIDKDNVKQIEVTKVAMDYGVDNTKKAMSNALIKIWSILPKSASAC